MTRFLTRRGCHLCEDALWLLRSGGVEVEVVDVDADDVLRGRYGERVPVVLDDAGRVLYEARDGPEALSRLLGSRGRTSR